MHITHQFRLEHMHALQQVSLPYWLCRALFACINKACNFFAHTRHPQNVLSKCCPQSPATGYLWGYMSVVYTPENGSVPIMLMYIVTLHLTCLKICQHKVTLTPALSQSNFLTAITFGLKDANTAWVTRTK